MSLIPYQSHEGREIVLRHKNAIVVRDPDSQRLDIRGSTCPTCHQPLPQSSNNYDRNYEAGNDSYVDPNYFRMLHQGNHGFGSDRAPSSPVRSLPVVTAGDSPRHINPYVEDEPEGDYDSGRRPSNSSATRIEQEARIPNYFKTFFVEEKVLGKGGKGVVLLVRHEIDGCQLGHFACKRVPVGDDHDWLKKVLVEVELLANLSHPNLVSYRHVWLEDVRLTMFGPRVPCAFILQKYCNGGDLHQHVIGAPPPEATKEELKARMRRKSKGQAEPPKNLGGGKGQLAFEEIYSLFKDITSGVAYLHGANYVHRDLKPSNCLLHCEGNKVTCLISDFGEVQPTNAMRNSSGATGTISYCAPEVLKIDQYGRYGNFTTKSDMFSLGMILYFMCFNRLPYLGSNAIQEELEDIESLRAEIVDWKGFQDERRERPDLPSKLYALLKKLLSIDPDERPSANEVLHVMKGETIAEGIKRPERNIGASMGLRGSRVEVLDSPAQPGTPTPESQRTRQPSKRILRSGSSDWTHVDGQQLGTDSGFLSSHYADTEPNESQDDDGSMTMSLVLNGLQNSATSAGPSPLMPSPTSPMSPTRLLLPAPRTRLGKVEDFVSDLVVRVSDVMGIPTRTFRFGFKLALFLVKLNALSKPCWPFMPSLEVGAPLIIVAALDLAWPANNRPSQGRFMVNDSGVGLSIVLLGLHFAALWLAHGWDSLCVARWEQ
ncbi:hypothetical protein VHEMI04755 [[Torrubiella] hemipterigena]|uniref:non-specific serine/threonine protein kinase n=1 Tax=[Torrubiella] hemipterigena TaxID=1531966 RepID=A0A0A1TF85_9HYPO|nr:hypothetical protein VHEMI04755 [[Torrubiella] hemipterigena]